MSEQPRAVVREIDGKLVLDDPDGLAVIEACNKYACGHTLKVQRDRVEHFKQQIVERRLLPRDVVIVLINVDDQAGAILASHLMPGHDWQQYRDRGEVPFVRGLAGRDSVQYWLYGYDEPAAAKLREIQGVACVVVDHGTAEVFEV